MVEPSKNPDMTFTVPGDLVARLMAADAAETAALDAVCNHKGADNQRALAAARRELADAYDKLASRFVGFFPVFHALREYAYGVQTKATDGDCYAASLDSRTGGEPS